MTENSLWYKNDIFYELYVRAFRDSNADGWGDLKGVTEKLDYLSYLGVDTIWLLPISPRRCATTDTTSAITAASILCTETCRIFRS